MILVCENCHKEFESPSSRRFCSNRCSHSYSGKHQHGISWKCDCGELFESRSKLKAHRETCEIFKKCRAIRLNTSSEESRRRLSATMRRLYSEGVLIGCCKDPEKESLRRSKISQSMRGNENWKYNKSRGRGKKGWYKGIYCDSSWELAYLVYHLDHNLSIRRCEERRKYIYEGKERIYIPDFITSDGIIEIKGYLSDQSRSKSEQNPDIKVLTYKDLVPYIKYAESTYGVGFWKVLYDK